MRVAAADDGVENNNDDDDDDDDKSTKSTKARGVLDDEQLAALVDAAQFTATANEALDMASVVVGGAAHRAAVYFGAVQRRAGSRWCCARMLLYNF